MRLIGLLLLLAVLVVGYRQWTVPDARSSMGMPGIGMQVSNAQPVATVAAPSGTTAIVAPSSDAMTPAMVMSWCVSGACDAARFEQTPESNGVVNPNSVHFRTGPPASFTIPAGVYVQNWDCFTATTVQGPATTAQTCEATFRRG